MASPELLAALGLNVPDQGQNAGDREAMPAGLAPPAAEVVPEKTSQTADAGHW